MNRYEVRLTERWPTDKWKTITITASSYFIDGGGVLHFHDIRDGSSGIGIRAFASGEWSRVRKLDAA